MITDKPFRIAFIFSLGLHSMLLLPFSGLVKPPIIKETRIEVTYVEIQQDKIVKARPLPEVIKEVSLKKDEGPSLKSKEPAAQESKIEEPKAEVAKKKQIVKKESTSTQLVEVIDLNSIYLHKGTSETIGYLRTIRDGINSYVNKKYEASMGEGAILLHFVLNSDGSVYSATIIRENAVNNRRLRNLCLDSVYFSSPYKPFPKALNLEHATFNISISFKKR